MLAKPMRSRHDFNQLIMPPVSRLKTVLSATVSCHLRVKSPQPSCTPSALIHPAPSHLLITAALSVRPSIIHPFIVFSSSRAVRGSYFQPRLKYFFIHSEICARMFPFLIFLLDRKVEFLHRPQWLFSSVSITFILVNAHLN